MRVTKSLESHSDRIKIQTLHPNPQRSIIAVDRVIAASIPLDKASGRQVGIKSSVPVETRQLVISAVTPSAWILEHELIGSEPACSMIAQPTTHNAFGPSKKCPRERTGCLLDRSNYRWDWLA